MRLTIAYDQAVDLPILKNLMHLRGMPSNTADDLPSIGFMAFEDGHLIAAAFLREVSRKTAVFDGLISDPAASSESRDHALDSVLAAVVKKAKELGFTQMIAWTEDTFTLMRSKRHGFQQLPHAVVAIDLSK